MFYTLSFERKILIYPRVFGIQLLEKVKRKLGREVEGTCTEKYGYIVAIVSIPSVETGTIQPGQCYLLVKVNYEALVFRPLKDELLDAEVTHVDKVGLYAEIGPLTCFISRHALQAEMIYGQNGDSLRYKTDKQNRIIGPKDKIRVKVVRTRVKENEIFACVTFLDGCLCCLSVNSYKIGKTYVTIHVR